MEPLFIFNLHSILQVLLIRGGKEFYQWAQCEKYFNLSIFHILTNLSNLLAIKFGEKFAT